MFLGESDDTPSVTLSLCDEASVATEPSLSRSESLSASEDVVITTIAADADDPNLTPVQSLFASGVHFLSHDSLVTSLLVPKEEPLDEMDESNMDLSVPGRRELLEYLIQPDGSVVCKWCGEVLPSRTHWYRHKYKFHVSSPPGTTNLFKCYRCNVFFKSRKGYVGHISSRHSENENKFKDEKTESLLKASSNDTSPLPARSRRGFRNLEDIPGSIEEYEKQREKEEKLVAEIIDRVKKECEAQGSTVTRRGYSRRQTVMNT